MDHHPYLSGSKPGGPRGGGGPAAVQRLFWQLLGRPALLGTRDQRAGTADRKRKRRGERRQEHHVRDRRIPCIPSRARAIRLDYNASRLCRALVCLKGSASESNMEADSRAHLHRRSNRRHHDHGYAVRTDREGSLRRDADAAAGFARRRQRQPPAGPVRAAIATLDVANGEGPSDWAVRSDDGREEGYLASYGAVHVQFTDPAGSLKYQLRSGRLADLTSGNTSTGSFSARERPRRSPARSTFGCSAKNGGPSTTPARSRRCRR